MDRQQFEQWWNQQPENHAPHALDAAWRRYQHVQSPSYQPVHEPSVEAFQAACAAFKNSPACKDAWTAYCWTSLRANTIPWKATGVYVKLGQTVTTFASGRVWRRRELDMFLRPQFALWFRIGVNGAVFNSTADTNTFVAGEEGQLYVANQFPGQFGEPRGGRLASSLSVHDSAVGEFEIFTLVWKDGVDVQAIMEEFAKGVDPHTRQPRLIHEELSRVYNEAHRSVPDDWRYLWFLGNSTIYSLQTDAGERCMHCKPYCNTGILQKNFEPPLRFTQATKVSWRWLIAALPSRLREDQTFTHDYLSVAFEFENGRDLTYTWSWELPVDFGYWCPLPAWADREYHVVIRSGTQELGQWLDEIRDLYADYARYVERGDVKPGRVPREIVRAWFIAGNRWQRHEGEMSVKRLQIHNEDGVVDVL